MDTLPTFRRTLHRAGLEDHVVALVGRSPQVARDLGHAARPGLHRRRPHRRARDRRLRGLGPACRRRAACSSSTTCSPTRRTVRPGPVPRLPPRPGLRRVHRGLRDATRCASCGVRERGSERPVRVADVSYAGPDFDAAPAARSRRGPSPSRRRAAPSRWPLLVLARSDSGGWSAGRSRGAPSPAPRGAAGRVSPPRRTTPPATPSAPSPPRPAPPRPAPPPAPSRARSSSSTPGTTPATSSTPPRSTAK